MRQSRSATPRIAPLDRARTLLTVLVVLHHSAINYTAFGSGDPKRWLGFDLVVLFNDSFFMAVMFLIAGLFVPGEWRRKGTTHYLRARLLRLGLPLLASVFVLMPLAYYPSFLRYHLPGTTDFSFLGFWGRTLTIGPWPSGPSWFLWVLLALSVVAALLLALAGGRLGDAARRLAAWRDRPRTAYAAFLLLTLVAYVPLRLIAGDSSWLEFGPFPVQTSRILLYASSFAAGLLIGAADLSTGLLDPRGAIVRRWRDWAMLALICYAAILLLVYARYNWIEAAATPPAGWHLGYAVAVAAFTASMAFALLSAMLRFGERRWPLLDRLQPSAYGIFLVHYVFIVWLQYALYDRDLAAAAKFAIVFAATLTGSWIVTAAARRIPAVARIV